MRLSIFIGLLYVAWSINPTIFDSLVNKHVDLFLIALVFVIGLFGDLKDLRHKEEQK
jgi:hypothetical protein